MRKESQGLSGAENTKIILLRQSKGLGALPAHLLWPAVIAVGKPDREDK